MTTKYLTERSLSRSRKTGSLSRSTIGILSLDLRKRSPKSLIALKTDELRSDECSFGADPAEFQRGQFKPTSIDYCVPRLVSLLSSSSFLNVRLMYFHLRIRKTDWSAKIE